MTETNYPGMPPSDLSGLDPIPVKVMETITEQEAPAWGTWHTFSWAAGVSLAASAQRILPHDTKRAKARVIVYAGATGLVALTPAPVVPASTVAQINPFSVPATVTVAGGTVTAIAINGTSTGVTSGTFTVPVAGTITLTYTVAPTTYLWQTAATNGYVQIGQREQVMNNQGGQLVPIMQVELNNSQETWIASDGVNGMIVTVLQERYM
jgi:predicted nicotinamide N-methyase